MSNTKKICISGVTMAMYIAIMYVTQGFAFMAWQIRIATALYSLSYLFPFLVVPLALANMLSNIVMGGLGIFDIAGGLAVGIITTGAVYLVRRFNLPMVLVIPVLILGPGLVVPIWLSYLLNLPYLALVASVSIGQVTPAVVGYFLIKILKKHMKGLKLNEQP